MPSQPLFDDLRYAAAAAVRAVGLCQMMRGNESLLIAAVSGRALAQSARRSGFRPTVLDCFADRDTRAAAKSAARVSAGAGYELDQDALLRAAERLDPAGSAAGLIYGAGFEAVPDALARLAQGRRLYGNPPDVLRRVKEPVPFFALLKEFGISHPETRQQPPRWPAGWLAKSTGGSGGGHVKFYDGVETDSGRYYQRRLRGPTRSVLFLADGERVRIVGYHRLWCLRDSAAPFLFGGLITDDSLPSDLRAEIERWVQRLVCAVGLRGLNSLDFVVHGRRPWAIDLNPRPGASLELHDRRERTASPAAVTSSVTSGLLRLHIEACCGRLFESGENPDTGSVRGLQVVYATRAFTLPAAWDWPAYCTDLPDAGDVLPAGAPVCTVHAAGESGSEVRRSLARRSRQVLGTLFSQRCAA